jgi:predicted GIY-YIG superfamily endonuclease
MAKKYFVYVIMCKERRRYIGVTSDWKKRLDEHNDKLFYIPQWTRRFSSWQLIYLKKFDNYTEARKWEIYLKKQKGGTGLKYLLKTTNEYSGVEQSGSSGGS